MSDTYFPNVSLLLHCDAADQSQTFVDSSAAARTVYANNGAWHDTSFSKFGSASAQFQSSDDALTLTANAAFGFGSGSWTFESWVRVSASTLCAIADTRATGQTGADRLIIGLDATSRCLFFQYGSTVVGATGTAPATNAWALVEVNYDGTTVRGFVDGSLVWSAAHSLSLHAAPPLRIGSTYNALYGVPGHLDDIRITKGVCRHTAGYSVPTEAFSNFGDVQALVSVGTLLGAPAVLGALAVVSRIELPSILGAPAVAMLHDFSALVGSSGPLYAADLVTPGGAVRVPISSWQATLRAGEKSYVQCVVPACTPFVANITDATEFVIYRKAKLVDGSTVEYEMARAPAQTLAFDQGPNNYTATISGYVDGLPEQTDPPASYDRTLDGIRSQHTGSGGARIRCAIDWFLRPGQRAFYGATSFVVSYINYYVPGFDEYMDVGEELA